MILIFGFDDLANTKVQQQIFKLFCFRLKPETQNNNFDNMQKIAKNNNQTRCCEQSLLFYSLWRDDIKQQHQHNNKNKKDVSITNMVDFYFPSDRDNCRRVQRVLPERVFSIHFYQMSSNCQVSWGLEPVIVTNLSKSGLLAPKILLIPIFLSPKSLEAWLECI